MSLCIANEVCVISEGDTGARVFLMHMVQTQGILTSQEKQE